MTSDSARTPQPEAAQTRSPKLLKAGDLARQNGITRQMLHQYVTMGLLEPVETTQGGQRLFNAESVTRVKLIRQLCACGYTLRDVREIFFEKR